MDPKSPAQAPITELDLEAGAVLGFFARAEEPRLLAYLATLDRQDRWAVDFGRDADPDVDEYLGMLQRVIARCTPVLHEAAPELAEVLQHVTTSRCLYLMRYVAEHNADFFAQVGALLASSGGSTGVLRRRLEALHRARLLATILSSERLERIINIMGSYRDD